MLLCLVERLGHEQEVSWLDSICQELVGCCDELTGNPGVSRVVDVACCILCVI
jgi:hypothetical protein